MEESKASGRLICSSSVAHWSDVVASLRTKYPMYPFETKYVLPSFNCMFFIVKLTSFYVYGSKYTTNIVWYLGLMTKKETEISTPWMLLRFCTWGSQVSKLSLKYLMIASKASKLKGFCSPFVSRTN